MYLTAGDVSTREGEQTVCSTKLPQCVVNLFVYCERMNNSIRDAGCAMRDQKLCLDIYVIVVLV